MASQETSFSDADMGIWNINSIDDQHAIASLDQAADETSSSQVQSPAQDTFDDAWWFSYISDADSCDIQRQQTAEFNSSKDILDDFALIPLPADDVAPLSAPGNLALALEQTIITTPSLSSATPSDILHLGSNQEKPTTPSKIGNRFSRNSIRVLKSWLATHNNDPYPSDSQKKVLQEKTGLSRMQVENWLANARRRGKMQISRTTSPQQAGQAAPIAIPPRPPTPAIPNNFSVLNPLERWVESPPEHEPACALDIARAVASNISGPDDASSSYSLDQTGYPRRTPSAGSIDTSLSSGGSFSSANSHGSHNSLNSFDPFRHPRSRRRKRVARRTAPKTPLGAIWKKFQCTFCTETFGRKYDWQRHENSLHLPLERWVCAPNGPRCLNPNNNLDSCVFCGLPDPSDQHIESHNYLACQERAPEERMFNRKDHLRQHLRLFHNAGFSEWPMNNWRASMPEIHSKCGFCNLSMNTWRERAEHIADHFKLGKTMADWEGDWGFEESISQIVENAIPPYFIETERHSPFPFEGSGIPAETPRNAYELIKLELAYFMQNYYDRHKKLPTIEMLQLDACRVILASKTGSRREDERPQSWLQDLILSDQDILQKARLGSIRSPIESRLSSMKINGKTDMFERCTFEFLLQKFARNKNSQGPVTDHELQEEACRIVVSMDRVSFTPSEFLATWLMGLIRSSPDWLSNFRERMNIYQDDEVAVIDARDTSLPTHGDYSHQFGRESQMEYVGADAYDVSPQDQNTAHTLGISGEPRPQIETDPWLSTFQSFTAPLKYIPSLDTTALQPGETIPDAGPSTVDVSSAATREYEEQSLLGVRATILKANGFFLGGPNFYRWVGEELRRWAIATMSPHNPACHVPTDEEIQHYARWIAYNDGDPLNQTLADNAYWLASFKKEVGISNDELE